MSGGVKEDRTDPAAARIREQWLRVFAALGSIPLAGLLVWGAALVALLLAFTAVVPDASDTDGEFGSAPNSWGSTFSGLTLSLGAVFVWALLLAAIVALLWFAATGRPLRRRVALWTPVAITGTVALVAGGWLFAKRGEARLATDCDAFRYDRAAFTSSDRAQWGAQVRGLADCDVLRGLTGPQVQTKLGSPQRIEPGGGTFVYQDGALEIDLERGRVASAWAW